MTRCPWCGTDPQYVAYHDREWGVPATADTIHFEFLLLESAQAGLSWLTILRKRENYRKAYAGFDPRIVANFTDSDIRRLLADSGIVRNRRKVAASLQNARAFLAVQREWGSFSRYIWSFVNFKPVVNQWSQVSELPARSDLSDRVSRDMKQRGFSHLGSVTVYAHLQAAGLINDHLTSCFRYSQIKANVSKTAVRRSLGLDPD